MAEIKLTVEAPNLHIDNADATTVLRLLAAYLTALSQIAGSVAKGANGLNFSLPRWENGSVRAVCESQNDPSLVAKTQRTLAVYLENPSRAPHGTRTSLNELRQVIEEFPDDTMVVANGIGAATNLTEIVQCLSRRTITVHETIRARITKVGGRPRSFVRVASASEGSDFSLRASEPVAREAGKSLYEIVEIEAELVRLLDDDDMRIVRGRALSLTLLRPGPTLEELRRWFTTTHPTGVALDNDE
jgi:hypothetical protein